jgi:hypothetical protein
MGTIRDQLQTFVDAVIWLLARDEPRNLVELANSMPGSPKVSLLEDDLIKVLENSEPADRIKILLGDLIMSYDRFPDDSVAWSKKTKSFSRERRDLAIELLGLSKRSAELISKFRPVPLAADRPIVIGDPEAFKRWYLPSRIEGRDFYWRNYREHLRLNRGLESGSLMRLDISSSEIVGRLADPTSVIPYSTRGIVVGYVQSGKTTNFTAVIAKAIDAGYRMVIVLTGMHEALRRQTQRRLDMELLGKPNILNGLSELSAIGTPAGQYLADEEWINGGFSDLGGKIPQPGIIRLTDYKTDYNNQKTHALNIVAPDNYTDLFDPKNLYGVQARIAIVKKNGHVLTHLLKSIEMNEHTAKQLPTLIIDDESDQASVNTAKLISTAYEDESKEEKDERIERKKINASISNFLDRMPRAQYVGYTATPFANVFVDYEDSKDIFPKDFLIALDEPEGYMGTSTFFDGAGGRSVINEYELSSKDAYIRELHASNNDLTSQESELTEAIASFIVTGAIKLFRLSMNDSYKKSYRHHTMLIHEAAFRGSHKKTEELVTKIWGNAEWRFDSGCELLKNAFNSFVPTMKDRGINQNETPKTFEDIEPFVKKAIDLMESEVYSGEKSPILVVNGDAEVEARLDFDHKATWKIVVGGAMLSRGFTIEGLTISYFRRAPRAHDTLLQMGRWFGYRFGYQDLVRIYLAANASITKKQTVNLYEAFKEIAISEEAFRDQLAIYSAWDGEQPAITPKDIRPLVLQSLPWLKPTAAAKMQLAKIKRQREDIFSPKAMSMSSEEVANNWKHATNFVKAANNECNLAWKKDGHETIPAYFGVVSVTDLTGLLKASSWLDDYYEDNIQPKSAYYEHCFEIGILKNFIVVFPQLMKTTDKTWLIEIDSLGTRTGVMRKRNGVGYYGEFTDERHRDAVKKDILQLSGASAKSVGATSGQGVILAYLIPERGLDGKAEPPAKVLPEACSLGLTIYLPPSATSGAGGAPIEWEGTTRIKS